MKRSFFWALLVAGASLAGGCSKGAGRAGVEAGVDVNPDGGATERDDASEARKRAAALRDAVLAGRALEAGDASRAAALLPDDDRPEIRWLAARIAAELGRWDEAIDLLRGLEGAREDLEPRRRRALCRALGEASRYEQALIESERLLDAVGGSEVADRARWLELRAEWLGRLGREEQKLEALEAARDAAGSDGRRDRLGVELARERIEAGLEKEAREALEEIAAETSSASAMRDAEKLLEEIGAAPEWKPRQRLERARRLADLRAWDEAEELLEPLLDESGRLGEEARWERARLLFRRRRHYAEAVEALREIIDRGSAHADEARFLHARALSRLDRDAEAIEAYRDFARKTSRPARADYARFLAGRLEYFLGRHADALATFEKLAGRPKASGERVPRKEKLAPGRARDAHFLAGMSALLDGRPLRAAPHFGAASDGSSSRAAIERNRYWLAVARVEAVEEKGYEGLRAVCEDDATSWYAQHARCRLEEAGEPLGACGTDPPDAGAPIEVVDAGDAGAPGALALVERLAPLAGFFARVGLYRDAAGELRRVESEGEVEADEREWIAAYLHVDAPHRAVRRAYRGLRWPPERDDLWRARAAYPEPFARLVSRVESRHELPRHLVHAIARKESLFEPHAVSPVGALGMMQMMPHTYERNRKKAGLPPRERGEIPGPEASIRAAAYELEALLERFGGSLPLAVMGYNAGPGAVSRWLERSGDLPMDVFVEKASFTQTRNYVRRVYRILCRYHWLAGEEPPRIPRVAARPKAGEDAADAGENGGSSG
ncbi:MAG: transglycosylase SLT domain-containing protein [Polyangia bacterium]